VEVDVSVAEGAPGDGVTADTDGGNGSDSVENLEKKTLVNVRGEVPNVKRGGVERSRLFMGDDRAEGG